MFSFPKTWIPQHHQLEYLLATSDASVCANTSVFTNVRLHTSARRFIKAVSCVWVSYCVCVSAMSFVWCCVPCFCASHLKFECTMITRSQANWWYVCRRLSKTGAEKRKQVADAIKREQRAMQQRLEEQREVLVILHPFVCAIPTTSQQLYRRKKYVQFFLTLFHHVHVTGDASKTSNGRLCNRINVSNFQPFWFHHASIKGRNAEDTETPKARPGARSWNDWSKCRETVDRKGVREGQCREGREQASAAIR